MTPRRRSRSSRRTAWLRRPRRVLAGLLGLALGFGLAWTWYLDRVVSQRMTERPLAYPSRVYARPLELYAGQAVGERAFQRHLAAAGYREQAGAPRPGTYDRGDGGYRVHRRAFRFAEGPAPAVRLQVAFDAGRVASVTSEGRDSAIERLDPALIGRIYPAGGEDREYVPLDAVPPLLVQTLVALEDRAFFHHHGLDFSGIIRAAWANLRAGRVVQGGSTLTQQLVKNLFLTRDRTYLRKANEALMALLLEWRHDKRAILEAYLNEVYLGRRQGHPVHGVGRGSEVWFGRPVAELAPHQLALLAGLIRAPSWYDPRSHPDRARDRRNRVLGVMASQGLLEAGEAARLAERPLDVAPPAAVDAGRYPAFLSLVRRELAADYRAADLQAEGLMIFTTLDPVRQHQAQAVVASSLERVERDRGVPVGSLEAALALTRAGTGDVLALVGGRRGDYAGFNRALDARRPVGSLLKPFVYLTALARAGEYNLATPVEDEPVALELADGSVWRPRNVSGRFHGAVPLFMALAHSYNAATVNLGLALGVERVVETLKALGVRRELPAYPSLLLGAADFSVVEMAQLYQALASGGHPVRQRAVSGVLTGDGERIRRYPLELQAARWPEAAYLVNWALKYAAREGTARMLAQRPAGRLGVAGKTGTSNEGRDGWFAGFSADHLAVVWVGRDDNRPAGLTGAGDALPIFAELMDSLPSRELDLQPPAEVTFEWVLLDGPRLADADCPGAVELPFARGSAPRELASCARQGRGMLDWVRGLFGDGE